MSGQLTHLSAAGAARMVDVSAKQSTERTAAASAVVMMRPETLDLILLGSVPKGDVLALARIAGIMAAKRVSELIPLCHPLALNSVVVDLKPQGPDRLGIEATVAVTARTGVEMEALAAVMIAALTVYDMCKAVDREMLITDVRLTRKAGGRSGDYQRSRSG
jgi:cyclic pyranopterin monophosphate synthase